MSFLRGTAGCIAQHVGVSQSGKRILQMEGLAIVYGHSWIEVAHDVDPK